MTWTIKGNDGTVKATVHALEYNGEWMGERYVTVTVESPYPIEFAIGDYLEYRGERFEINYDPGKIKSAPSYIKGDAFKYENIKFNSLADELTRCEFRDVVPSDNQIHYTSLPKFTFYGGVRDLAGRIQANLDRTYPGKWTVTVSDEYAGDKELNVSVDNQNVWDALSILVNDFETYFTINGRTITIGAAGIPAGHLFKYGKGNGLYEIEQNAEADQAIVTRLRAYGSERNLPHRYYHNLPNIDRAHADIHAVIGKTQLNNGAVDCVATFVFLGSYIDTQKCFKYTNADNETFYWLTVTLNGKSYAASVDTSKSPQQIVLGYRPPKGYSGSSNWVLHKPDMDAITSGTSVAFDCYKPTAPGIVEGQHVPNNMAVNFLMLPGFPETTLDPYIDSANIDALGVREGTVFFDGSQEGLEEIYPSIEGMTAEQLIAAGVPCISPGALDMIVSAEQMTDNGIGEVNEPGNSEEITPATFKVTLKDLGFNLWAYRVAGEAPVLSFKTGMLGGRDFEIVGCVEIKDSYDKVTGYEVELNRVYDDDIKLWFPYSASNAKPGDKFVLLHIEMPEVYIKAASQRLLEAATAWLAKNDYSRSVYAPKVDEIFMARQHDEAMASGGSIKSLHDTLTEGMLLLFEDSDLNIDASIFIDRLTIKESNGPIPTYEVTLKEEKTVGRLDRMQNQIDSLASGRGQGSGYTAAQIRSMIDAYGGERFLSKIKADRTPYRLSSDTGFEAGNYSSGVSGGMLGIDKTDGSSFAEVDDMRVRRKAYFETLTTMEATTLAGKHYLTPGGSIKCVRVEEVKDTDGDVTAYRCWFLSEQSGEKTNTKIIEGDQCISEMFNAKTGTANKVSNHRYWRLVTGVSNDAHTDDAGNHYGYIDLSATDCEPDSDIPQEGDVLAQFGNRTDVSRQGAIVLSAVDFDAPAIKMLAGIGSGDTAAEHYSLDGKDITAQGYDHTKGHAYMKVYGDTYIGAKDKSTYFNFDQDTKSLDIKAVVNILGGSTIEGELTLSSLIRVGYKQDGVLFKTMAGMNGAWIPELGGRTIAAWYGGPMVDLFDKDGNRLDLAAGSYATSLLRMDGSAYWASGNIQFRANGTAQFGLDDSAITIGADGHLTIGNGISINIGGNAQGLGESIASVTELANKLSHLFTPYLGNSAKSWASIKTLSDYDSIKVNKSIWTDGFVSARGLNGNGGTSGGSGKSYLSDLLDVDLGALSSGQVLTWNGTKWVNSALTLPDMAGYALESWVEANYYTKAEVNAKNYIKAIECYKTTEWNEIRSTSDSMTMRAFDVYGKEAGGPYITGNVLEIVGRYNHWQPQLWFDGEKGGRIRHRNKTYNNNTWGDWYILLDTHNYASVLDTAYVKKTGDTMTGLFTISAAANGLINLNTTNASEVGMRFLISNAVKGWAGYHTTYGTNLFNYQCGKYLAINDSGVPNLSGSTIWHAGNDGSGSGLDADLLDGKHLADILASNVASASRLQAARTIWGHDFDGTGDVSGNMSGVGSIVMNGGIEGVNYIELKAATPHIDFHFNNDSGDYTSRIMERASGQLSINNTIYANYNGLVGIAGLLKALSGIQIGSTADIGWYFRDSRLCAGNATARGVNVGSLLVSGEWADATKVPTHGIYATGEIISSNINAFRAISGDYGAIIRNDGTHLYFLLTNSKDQYGSYNGLRPLYINLATGLVKMQQGLQIGGCTISWDAANNMLKFDKGLYSEGPVSARGVNANGGSGGGSGNYLQINGDNATDATLPHLFQKLYEYDSALIDGDFMFVSDEQSQLEYGWRITMLQLWNYIKSKMGLAFTVDGDNVAIGCQPGKLTLNGVTINAGSAVTCNSLTAQSVTANGVTIGGPSADCVKIKYQGKTYTLQLAKLIQAGYLT